MTIMLTQPDSAPPKPTFDFDSNSNNPRGHPAEFLLSSLFSAVAVYSLHSINDFATLTLGPSLTSSSSSPAAAHAQQLARLLSGVFARWPPSTRALA